MELLLTGYNCRCCYVQLMYRLIGINEEVKLNVTIEQQTQTITYSRISFIAAPNFFIVLWQQQNRIIKKIYPLIWICY